MNTLVWKKYQGVLIPDTPPHHNIKLNTDEQKELFTLYNPYFIRWTNDFDLLKKSSFWYIIKDSPEELSKYNSKMRNQINKGLKNTIVEKISRDTLIQKGYEVYIKAYNNYQVFQKPLDYNRFQTSLLNLDSNWEFWGVYSLKGDLIAYAQNYVSDNTCNYSTVKLDPDFLPLYPAYALFYTMNLHYLNKRNMRYVHDGSRNLAHATNIQNFLCDKFKFRKAYCTMHITYRADIACFIKLLYSFQPLITHLPYPWARKISVLLKHEEIRRSNGQ